MRTKTLVLIAGGALVLAGLAWGLAQRAGKPVAVGTTAPTKLFPEASARIGEASRVVITKGDQQIEVARSADGKGWGIPSRDHYAAVEDNVRRLIRGVLEAEVVDKKTAQPDLYARIGVEDPKGKDAKSHQVSVFDGQGKPLAELIIGNRFEAANWDTAKAGTFVRPASDAQSYLVKGTFDLAATPVDWLKRDVLALDPSRFWKVAIQHPASADGKPGEAVHVERKSRGEESYTLAEMPQGRELADPTAHTRVLQTLASWTLEDVKRVDGFDMTGAVEGTFVTFDGIVYTTKCVEREGKHWATVRCAFDATQAAPRGAGDEAPAADHDEKMKKEADEINARLTPWVYQIAQHKGKELSATVDGLLKPLPPPGQPTATPGTEPPSPLMAPPGGG